MKAVYEKYPSLLEKCRIYNLDETSVSTVVSKPTKVLAKKGDRVITPTAAERGSTVTVVGIICANGNFVPPTMIFPRVNFQQNMLIGAYPGTKGLATPSGWIKNDLFIDVLKHFQLHTSCSLSESGGII